MDTDSPDRSISTPVAFDTGAPDLGRSRVARYLQLATLFRNRISSGRWPVGSRIPNVDTLAQDFGVARETIRQALGLLEREGCVERFRAKGTFVRRSPSAGVPHNLHIDWGSLATAHEGAELEVLAEDTVDALPIAVEEGTPAERYRMMRRRHIRDGVPYLVGTFFLDERLYKSVSPERFRREPTLRILMDDFADRIASGRQVLTIGTADVEIAPLLEVPINAPIAQVMRYAVDSDGTLVYVGIGIYRGDTLRLEIDLR